MNLLQEASLTENKRLVLIEDEIQYITSQNVSIYNKEKTVREFDRGIATVSSHHLYWVDTQYNKPRKLPLQHVHQIHLHASVFRRTPYILMSLHDHPQVLRISIEDGSEKEFFSRLEQSLSRKSWVQKKKAEKAFSTRNAGIAGVMRNQQRQRDEAKQLTQEAFTDLDALMEKAKDLVHVIDRYSNSRLKDSSSGSKDTDNSVNELMYSIGISNPVTKEACGGLFHQELARQLADFLSQYFKHSNNHSAIIALTDCYALFNRARGTELISPNDLLQAAQLFAQLQLKYRLHRFDSGVLVIQSASHGDKEVVARLAQLVEAKQCLTPVDVANELSISLIIAQEHLKTAERALVLCRDETLSGTTFYPNRFPVFSVAS